MLRHRIGPALVVRALCALLAALAASCHEPKDFLLSPTDVDSFLSLSFGEASLSADGLSRTTVTAKIDGNASADARTVEFTTTIGFLTGNSGKPEKSATASADSSGQATVVISSDTQSGPAIVTASVKRGASVLVSNSKVFTFVPPVATTYFTVTTDRTTAPADGSSETFISIATKLAVTQGRRTYDLSTSDGLFLTTGGATSAELKGLVADDNGNVTARLRSPVRPGSNTVRVVLTDIKIAHDVPILFTNVSVTEQISLVVSSASPPADGVTTTMVTAQLPRGGVGRVVKFEATGGTNGVSITSQAVATPDGIAVAFLTSPKLPLVSELTATVSEVFVARATVIFARALPDFILAAPTAASVAAGLDQSVQVDVQLRRNIGNVSDGTLVIYSAFRSGGQPVGVFSKTTLSVNGASSALLSVPTDTPAGTVEIRVTVPGSGVAGATQVAIR